jgi:hypothetical protein
MSCFSLALRVDAGLIDGEHPSFLSSASMEVRKKAYAALGLKIYSVAWVRIVPGSAKGDAVIRRLRDWRDAGDLVVGSAILTETFDDRDAEQARWFYLHTRTVDDFNLWDPYPRCKTGSLPKVHALNHTFVSSAFASTVDRRRLTGLSFLQCENRGRKHGTPWFVALPDESLGRGLDHPWFDRARWLRDVGDRPERRSSAIDVGQYGFHQWWLRKAAECEAPLDRILPLGPTPPATSIEGVQLVMMPRYWSEALPASDFAYVPWGEDGPNREGKILRFRMLAVSARARAVLLDDGLFDRKAFLPVRVIDSVEPGIEILDRSHDRLPPMYSASEVAALRSQEARLKTR